MMVKREVARKNAAICKREASTFSLSSPSCLKENQWESQLNSYLRMKTSDEEVYEEGPPRALQTGVKEWLDGGKKRHAQAQVWCTSVTQNRYGWPGNQLSSLMLILVASRLLLHIAYMTHGLLMINIFAA